MDRIRLTIRELELLNDCFMEEKQKFEMIKHYIAFEIDKNGLENIIDIINSVFLKRGLKKDKEPNSLGFELEELNDKFIVELQKINNIGGDN